MIQKKSVLLLFLLPLYLLTSCSEQNQKLRIVSWNVQNLFDLEWQGTEYPEYDPRQKESGKPKKWTAGLLQYRLKKLSSILDQLDADIYALIEVESEAVLQQLNAKLERPLPYSLLLRQRDQAVNMALLSRLPIVRSARHEVGLSSSGRSLRAIVEIVLELPYENSENSKNLTDDNPPDQLILLLNHWKSQRGGILQTAAARRKAAVVLNQRGRDLQRKTKKEAYIIALGDFNEPIDSYWRQEDRAANASSFLPQKSRQQQKLKEKEAMYIWAKPFAKILFESQNIWFSPWFAYACNQTSNKKNLKNWHTWPNDCLEMGKLPENLGSYAFRGKWQTIDHVFLNSAFFRNENSWHFSNFEVARFPPLLKETEEGQIPNAWRNNQGVSDHLPIILELEDSP